MRIGDIVYIRTVGTGNDFSVWQVKATLEKISSVPTLGHHRQRVKFYQCRTDSGEWVGSYYHVLEHGSYGKKIRAIRKTPFPELELRG